MIDRAIRMISASALCIAALGVPMSSTSVVEADELSPDDIVAYLVEGTGNGHGRGLSQWGAYGWAVEHGWTWEQILDHYYGGTTMGSVAAGSRIRVRLMDFDGASWVGVVSAVGRATWSAPGAQGGSYASSLRVVETSSGRFEVSVGDGLSCPGSSMLTVPDGPIGLNSTNTAGVREIQTFLTAFDYDPKGIDGDFGPMTQSAVRAFQTERNLPNDGVWNLDDAEKAREIIAASTSDIGWRVVASNVVGPITFTTDLNESSATNSDVLGLCSGSGAVTHYRGAIEFHDTSGGNRVVNDVLVENYLRGVVPKEVSASWGSRGDGAGMNALRAQAVAARSYGLTQDRYDYATTCDTSSCQVYGGAATRATAGATTVSSVEQALTDEAIVGTAGKVRFWAEGNLRNMPVGSLVSTEFSASNGPQTAGGYFPSVVDTGDAVALNPNHRWTRIISVAQMLRTYPNADASRVTTVVDPESTYVGIYANRVRLAGNSADDDEEFVSAWSFRGDFGLPSPGFTLTPVTRGLVSSTTFAFIGDSVGESVTGTNYGAELPTVLNGVFAASRYDALSSRRTSGGSIEPDGVGAAGLIPEGTDLVVVELGYNDEAAALATRIDEVMQVLVERGVGTVAWLTLSERRMSGDVPRYALANEAIKDARGRWPQLIVLDWEDASNGTSEDRWYSDGVHLTTSGQAEFTMWLRNEIITLTDAGWLSPASLDHFVPITPRRVLDTRSGVGIGQAGVVSNATIEVQVAGEGGVPGTDVEAVWANITVVEGRNGTAGGYVTSYPCGEKPVTSNLNFTTGDTLANSALLKLSPTGSTCLYVYGSAHLLLDVFGYAPTGSGLRALAPSRIVDTRGALGAETNAPLDNSVLPVSVAGHAGVPSSGVASVVVNITSTQQVTTGGGYVTAYDCGEQPYASNLNFRNGKTIANLAVVPLSATGEVCFAMKDRAHLVVDVVGYFLSGAGIRSETPRRVIDTRGVQQVGAADGNAGPLEVTVAPVTDVDGKRVIAASVNVTVTNTTSGASGGGYATVYACSGKRPYTSNLNFKTGATVAGGVVAPVDRNGKLCVYLYGTGDVIVDVNGLITS